MAVIEACVEPLIRPDHAILAMEIMGLMNSDSSFAQIAVDAMVLID
jgi:hypothetical protein